MVQYPTGSGSANMAFIVGSPKTCGYAIVAGFFPCLPNRLTVPTARGTTRPNHVSGGILFAVFSVDRTRFMVPAIGQVPVAAECDGFWINRGAFSPVWVTRSLFETPG